MSLLSRSASSRTTPVSACSRSSAASAGALARMVAAPRIEASGVRNSCDTEPISASRKQLGLRTHLGFVERARDVEPFQRGRGVGQRVVDAAAHVGQRRAGDVAEIDGDACRNPEFSATRGE